MTDIRPISRYLAGCTCTLVARRYSPVSVHVTFTAQAEPIFAGSACMCVSSACFHQEGRNECEQSLSTSLRKTLSAFFPAIFCQNCAWHRRGCDTTSEDKVRSEVSLSSSIKRRELYLSDDKELLSRILYRGTYLLESARFTSVT